MSSNCFDVYMINTRTCAPHPSSFAEGSPAVLTDNLTNDFLVVYIKICNNFVDASKTERFYPT